MDITFWYSVFHVGSILTVILTLLVSSKILRSNSMPAVTLGWLLIIIFMPLIGIPLYLSFGERKLSIKLNNKKNLQLDTSRNSSSYVTSHPIHSLIVAMNLPASSFDNESCFDKDGRAAWHSLTTLLQNAEQSIDIAIFILGKDAVGDYVLSILVKKAKEGIKIRLLLDGVGSFSFTNKRYHPLLEQGAELGWFIPLIHRPFRGRTNLRNHRKMVIIDNEQVWAGGRNISVDYMVPDFQDENIESCTKDYLENETSMNDWVDMSFVQKGAIVANYLAIFEEDWRFALDAKKLNSNRLNAVNIQTENTSELQLIPSGPDVKGDPIYSVILTACYDAKNHIKITTPYYIPDDNIQKSLKLAAIRGVTVDLIIPEKSNHKIADIARNRALRELSESGVNIYLLPQMVHAKVMITDVSFAMAGSANLDIRSLFLNCELMSAFYSQQDINWLNQWFKSLLKTAKPYRVKPVTPATELIEGLALLGASQL